MCSSDLIRRDYSEDDLPEVDLGELNRRLAKATYAYNTAPDPDMGGLSPDQVFRLIHSSWDRPDSPIRFNTDLPLVELEKSTFFREARAVLTAIRDAGGVRATSSKKLARPFVAQMLELLCDQETLSFLQRHRKVVNEGDVPPIHIARVVAQIAGLIRIHKGKLTVPKAKAPLLSEGQAGELFRCLFVAFFRKFNMAYARPLVFELASIQTCIGYSLWRIGVVASRWRPVRGLEMQLLLPAVRENVEDEIGGNPYWSVNKILEWCLFSPMLQWGLLEMRHKQVSKHLEELEAVRITPLFRKFLRFDLET